MYRLRVNGRVQEIDAEGEMPLLWALRDILGLRGAKFGCGVGLCGACTVHLDGIPVRSCTVPVQDAANANIVTIEGVDAIEAGRRVQAAWVEHDVPQCGYCQPGQIMSATALLAATSRPTEEEVNSAMAGNICRCGTYVRIRKAIAAAAGRGTAA